MSDPGQVLVVCTGNICRSPYIERRLAQLTGMGESIRSAGTQAVVRSRMSPGSVRELESRGGNADGFEARQLTAQLVDQAGLVLCATRDHRRQVVQLNPRALTKTFAMADFSDLVRRLPPGPIASSPLDDPGEPELTRLARAAARERADTDIRGEAEAEIVDPIGQADSVYAQMADQVEALLPPIVTALQR